ncbi:hypothetical protein PsYK624_167150 [Phanerochaete sordida]|uniref:Uncharacterized protein n=1 Tax=Phanerochaete sordida TaxID=48140 RepID=A0A9P3GT21_9APHY|nr:hypothetical protein PsYK624_167150 [Phanerochaete sordida]
MTNDEWLNRGRKKKKRAKASHAPAGEQPAPPSEGRRKPSWIWMNADTNELGAEATSLAGMSDALRVEFLRARGRIRHYKEEVNYVVEEQRRVLTSLEKTALHWDVCEGAAARIDDSIQRQGTTAYAAEQAALQRGLAAKFSKLWVNTGLAAVEEDKGEVFNDKEPDNEEPSLVLLPATDLDASDDDEDLGLPRSTRSSTLSSVTFEETDNSIIDVDESLDEIDDVPSLPPSTQAAAAPSGLASAAGPLSSVASSRAAIASSATTTVRRAHYPFVWVILRKRRPSVYRTHALTMAKCGYHEKGKIVSSRSKSHRHRVFTREYMKGRVVCLK